MFNAPVEQSENAQTNVPVLGEGQAETLQASNEGLAYISGFIDGIRSKDTELSGHVKGNTSSMDFDIRKKLLVGGLGTGLGIGALELMKASPVLSLGLAAGTLGLISYNFIDSYKKGKLSKVFNAFENGDTVDIKTSPLEKAINTITGPSGERASLASAVATVLLFPSGPLAAFAGGLGTYLLTSKILPGKAPKR